MDPIEPWVDAEAVRKLAQSLLMPVNREPEAPTEVCFGDEFVGFVGPDIPAEAPQSASARTVAAPAEPLEDEPDPVALAQIQGQAREALASARQRAEHGGLLERLPSVPQISAPPAAPPMEATPPAPAPAAAPPPPPPPPPPQHAEAVEAPPVAAPQIPVPTPQAAVRQEMPAPNPHASSHAPFVERLHAYGQWLRSAVEAKAFFVTDRDGHVLMDQVRAPKLLQVARTLAQASHTANRHAGGVAVGSLHVKLGEASILEVLSVETSYGPLTLGIVVPSVLSSPAINVISSGLVQVVNGQPT